MFQHFVLGLWAPDAFGHEEGILIYIQSVWEWTKKENKKGVRLIYLMHNNDLFDIKR